MSMGIIEGLQQRSPDIKLKLSGQKSFKNRLPRKEMLGWMSWIFVGFLEARGQSAFGATVLQQGRDTDQELLPLGIPTVPT